MASIISETSNYLIIIFMAIYVGLNIYLLSTYQKEHNALYIVQNLCAVFMHAIAYFTIYYRSNDIRYFFFFALQLILLYGLLFIYQILYKKANKFLLNNTLLLLFIGFTILGRLNIQTAVRQFIISFILLLFSVCIPWILNKIEFYKKIAWIYAGIGVLLLATVFLTGTVTNGSKLAFDLTIVSFQPSEFVKISLVLFIAILLAKKQTFVMVLMTGGAVLAHVLFLVLSKDLGSAVIYFVIYVFMVYIATNRCAYLFGFGSLGLIASVAAYKMFSHVRVRFQTWLNPWNDMDRKGYQLTQSLFAIGTGGLFGMGLFRGAPATIPYVNKDFIFSAIAEEMGTLFAVLLLVLYLTLFLMIMLCASRFENMFYKLSFSGFGVLLIFQVLLTVGGGTRFIPLTGVTLPLISNGGSSAASTILMFGLMQGMLLNSVKEKKQEGILDEN